MRCMYSSCSLSWTSPPFPPLLRMASITAAFDCRPFRASMALAYERAEAVPAILEICLASVACIRLGRREPGPQLFPSGSLLSATHFDSRYSSLESSSRCSASGLLVRHCGKLPCFGPISTAHPHQP